MCVSTSLPLLLVLSNHPKRKNHTQKQHGFTMHDKKRKTLYQKNGKIVSTTDNYHYYLTIILKI